MVVGGFLDDQVYGGNEGDVVGRDEVGALLDSEWDNQSQGGRRVDMVALGNGQVVSEPQVDIVGQVIVVGLRGDQAVLLPQGDIVADQQMIRGGDIQRVAPGERRRVGIV